MTRSMVALPAVILVLAMFTTAQDNPLTISNGLSTAHVFPTVQTRSAALPPAGALAYHGGPVMLTANTYAIFWVPSRLQNGSSTTMSSGYQTVQKNVLADYPGHALATNNTQYYQGSTTKKYIQNSGKLAGSYVDTNPYPSSGCKDSATPGGCISDNQLQAEVERVMSLKGWTGGLSNMFLVFTSSGEGSCLDSSHCAYTFYCAYHSNFTNTQNQTVIYSNQPYGNTTHCQLSGVPSPSGNAVADAAATAATHELTEAITDPEGTAWWDSAGNEIGDLCGYNYGANTWDGGKANEMWNGHFYELQMEYDNHVAGCVQVGP